MGMGLLGAVIGGSIGLILGGPLGAVLGGVLGGYLNDPAPEQFLGRGQGSGTARRPGTGFSGGHFSAGASWRSRPASWTRSARNAQAQSALLVALISLAAKVAKADGQVTQREIATFDAFLKRDLGMSTEERRIAARIFNRARDSTLPASAFARQIGVLLADRPDRLRDLVSLLLKIAWADGRLDGREERLLRHIAADMGLTERDWQEAKALLRRQEPDAAYALLGLQPEASNQEIKRAYRRLAREYHPDRLASRGLPEDFTRFANEKLQAINQAYAHLRQERGI
jgi:DnaJ like chaperone protein